MTKHENEKPDKPAYCKDGNPNGDCLNCSLSHETVDCQGNALKLCLTCGEIIGQNFETCRACWEHAFDSLCYECGEPYGNGAETGCQECIDFLKDKREDFNHE